jgi:hypothetical protein
MIALPNTRIGLLIAFYGLQLGCTPAVVLSLSWITTTTSGHTKKLTMHAMWLIGYSVGQMVSPQWWKDKYKPRNRVPWTILLVRILPSRFKKHLLTLSLCIGLLLHPSCHHPHSPLVPQPPQPDP